MKKILLAIILTLIVPQLVLASWWNPISWVRTGQINNPNKEIVVKPEVKTQEQKASTTSNILEEKPKILKTQIITKTVNVDNPELIKQIEILKKERDEFKTLLENSVKRNTELNSKIVDLGKSFTDLEYKLSAPQKCNIDQAQLRSQIIEAQNKIEFDKQVQKWISEIESPKYACAREAQQESRRLDPTFDQACRILGY